jgi:hypothetical protein
MVRVYVDSCVFGTPDSHAQGHDWETFRDVLLELSSLRKYEFLQAFVSMFTLEHVMEAGVAPSWNMMIPMRHIQARDIYRLVVELLERLSQVEITTGVRDVLIEQPTCCPTTHLESRPHGLVESYHRLMALAALDGALHDLEQGDQFILTRGLPVGGAKVRASGLIADTEYLDASEKRRLSEYNLDVRNCDRTDDLDPHIDLVRLWHKSLQHGYIRSVVDMFVHRRKHAGIRPEGPSIGTWAVGSAFVRSLTQCGFDHEPRKIEALLRACSDTLLGINMAKTHPLRMGLGGGDPQRRRPSDGALAWRRDITYEYHLHYWLLRDRVEFASIGVHNEFSITE